MKVELNIDDILNELPKDARDVLISLLSEKCGLSPIKQLKQFIDQYEDDDPIDRLFALVCADIINQIANAIRHIEVIQGNQLIKIAIEKIRFVADRLQGGYHEHLVEECSTCDSPN